MTAGTSPWCALDDATGDGRPRVGAEGRPHVRVVPPRTYNRLGDSGDRRALRQDHGDALGASGRLRADPAVAYAVSRKSDVVERSHVRCRCSYERAEHHHASPGTRYHDDARGGRKPAFGSDQCSSNAYPRHGDICGAAAHVVTRGEPEAGHVHADASDLTVCCSAGCFADRPHPERDNRHHVDVFAGHAAVDQPLGTGSQRPGVSSPAVAGTVRWAVQPDGQEPELLRWRWASASSRLHARGQARVLPGSQGEDRRRPTRGGLLQLFAPRAHA